MSLPPFNTVDIGSSRLPEPPEPSRGLRETVERAPVGIAHFDSTGRFVYVNPMLCTIFGLSREHLLRITFQEISFADDLPACLALNAQLAAGTIPRYTHEKRFIRPDGSHVYARVIVTAVRDRSGGIDFFLGVVEDISEQWAAEQEREQLLKAERTARTEAEHASKLRDQVLAVVAHDLRNSVHTIMMSSGALAELPLSKEDADRQVALIRRASGSMDRLISDLLDVTHIELGMLAIQPERVAFADVVAESATAVSSQVALAGIELTSAVDPAIGDVECDRARISQVLGNLLGNAIKFTPRGGRITVTATSSEHGVVVSVRDTGIGIAAAELPRMFERYWQADRGKRGGVGLGLAIVRGIVDAHGGHIEVESGAGQGTTVTLSLPARQSAR